MEIALDDAKSNVIRAFEPGRVRIGNEWLLGHLIVTADRVLSAWQIDSAAHIDAASLAPAIALDPELILVGAGADSTLPNVELMAELAERRIGVEFMNASAACRTFNLLVGENRNVVLALFNPAIDDTAQP